MRKSKKEEAPCPQCTNNVAVGFLFDICKTSLSNKLDCKSLSGQYLRGEIDVEKIVEKIKEAAGNNKAILADVEEIDEIRKSGKY